MKVLSLTISNFGSFYGTHHLPMADLGLVFVRGENLDEPKSPSNGAGKSTIFDALDWALYGEHPRGDAVKGVVNEEVKKDCWVLVHLEEAGAQYIIFRYRQLQKGSGVKFFQHGSGVWANRTALDATKTQELIDEALGLDRTVFRAAVYRAQGDEFNFAAATDAERKELLTALIPELQTVDSLRERAKGLLADVVAARATEQGRIQQATSELAGLQSVDWTSAEESWQAQQAVKINQASTSLQIAQTQLQQAQQTIAFLPALQQEAAQLQATPCAQEAVWGAEYEARVGKRNAIDTALTLLRAKYQQIQAELNPFQSGQIAAGPCSRCKQPISGEHIQAEVTRLQALLVPLAEEGARVRLDSLAAGEAVREAEAARQQEAARNQAAVAVQAQKLGQVKAQIQQLYQVQQQLPKLEAQVTSWSFHLAGLTNEVWPGEMQKSQAMHREADLEQMLHHATGVVSGYERREAILTFWIDALTAKGLKNLIMDSRIEEMTLAANEWVQKVTGGTTWVRFETQTMTAAGKLSEKLNLRIFRHNPDGSITERNFRSWSGGEKTRVALGTDQGLAKLLADRAAKGWQLLILDESFSRGLDGGGREAVFEEVQKMHGGTVFVVDHTDIGGYFENVWVVRSQNRRSQVFIGGQSCAIECSDPWALLPGVPQ